MGTGCRYPRCKPIAKSSNSRLSQGELNRQLNAYIQWFEELLTEGRDGYLMTITFEHIAGSPQVILNQMHSDLMAMYGRLAKRTVRNPSRTQNAGDLPIGIFFPDSGHYSQSKRALRVIRVNGGLHLHGYIAALPTARCPETLDIHFLEQRDRYRVGRVRDVDVQHITHRPDYVADYALKALKRRRHSLDDVFILPRSQGELGGRGGWSTSAATRC